MKRKSMIAILMITAAVLTGCGSGASTTGATSQSSKEAAASSAEETVSSEAGGAESTESEEPLDKPVAVEKEGEESTQEQTELANPFVECKSIDAAGKAAGFTFALPEFPEGYEATAYRAIEGEMIEVILKNADKEMRLRKAKGSDDISGDYNEYQSSEEATVADCTVTEKGNDDGIHCATWTSGEYSYSITADEGLTADAVAVLVSGMMG